MLNFKNIKFKNFQSYGNNITEFKFDINPKTLIIGTNGNGKSTIINVLSYVLYNKSFNGVTNPRLINSINKKELWVEVEFDDYRVERGQKPNIFNIYYKNVLVPKPADSAEYQEMLEKQFLKLSFDAFKQIVILSKDIYTPFMKLTTPKRREVVESLLDLQIFSKMNTILKLKVSENDKNLIDINKDIDAEISKKTLIETHIKNLDEEFEVKKQAKEEEKNNLFQRNLIQESHLENLNKQLNVLNEKNEKNKEYKNKLQEINNTVVKLDNITKKYEDEIEKLSKSVCPTCNQEIHKTEEKEKQITEIEKNLVNNISARNKLDPLIAKINHLLKNDQKLITEINELNQQIRICEFEIKTNNTLIDKLEKEINQKGYDRDKLISSVEVLNENLNKFNDKKQELLLEKEIHKVSAVLLQDKGIKTSVIKNYIPELNKLINKYLADMNFYVSFELNENFNEIIKSRHRDEFSYDNFSAGERQRIDLAILFTWREIAKARNSMSTNLAIFDEILDASLDAEGVNDLMKIFDTIQNSNIFVISHNPNMEEYFNDVIKIEKKNNFSEILHNE